MFSTTKTQEAAVVISSYECSLIITERIWKNLIIFACLLSQINVQITA